MGARTRIDAWRCTPAGGDAGGKTLGFPLPHRSAGGGSDGNFTGAMGVPTLDGLGVLGAGGHTLEEHLVVESLVQRGRLMAGLLATLATP